MRGELNNMICFVFFFSNQTSLYTWWIQVEKSQHFCSVQHQISGLHYVVYLGTLKKITSHKKCNTFLIIFLSAKKSVLSIASGKKSSKNHLTLACNFCIMGFKIFYFFRKGIQLFWKTTMYLFLAFSCYFTWHIEFELKKLKIMKKICTSECTHFSNQKSAFFEENRIIRIVWFPP